MNKVVLIGRLTDEPTGGDKVGKFTLAVQRRYTKEGQPSADFIGIASFGVLAEFAHKYLHKGMKIAVVGRIQTGSYERNGEKVYVTDVIAEEIEFAESKKEG